MPDRAVPDRTADVVVLGTGPAGMAAAAAEGVDVVAVEPMQHIGGNAVWSTGYLALVGSQMQADLHDVVVPVDESATQRFVELVRRIADGAADDVPTFADGVAMLRLAEAVEATR